MRARVYVNRTNLDLCRYEGRDLPCWQIQFADGSEITVRELRIKGEVTLGAYVPGASPSLFIETDEENLIL